jgi:hypothetical protein
VPPDGKKDFQVWKCNPRCCIKNSTDWNLKHDMTSGFGAHCFGSCFIVFIVLIYILVYKVY